MFARRVVRGKRTQTAGHAQVQDQRALVQVNEQIFASSSHRPDAPAPHMVIQIRGHGPT